ncbi:MAG TPA: MFS transporter, partial [Vicinamibacteria bacterium]
VLVMSSASALPSLFVTVTLTRGLGQSALSVASLALVGMWFARRLNLAMGIYSVLVGMGFIAAFPAVGQAVLSYGWRSTWFGVGLVLVIGIAPLAWLLVRDNPEREGLALDGDLSPDRDRLEDLSLRDAIQSPAFWVFALSSSLFGLVYSGIALFNQSILEERGFDASTYHQVLVISTLLGLAANFGGGLLASRVPIQRVMGIGMAVLAAALLALPSVESYAHVVLYAVAMGVAGGVVTVVFFSVWGQAFGRRHLGRIQGCAQMMTVFASAVGPLLLAMTLESTGSYGSIFYILAAVVLLLGMGCWYVSLPMRPEASASEQVYSTNGSLS